MGVIDPELLIQSQEGTIIKEIKDANGMILGYKGRFLPHVYDNFTECLRENQNAHRIEVLKKQGLNQHGQDKQQEEEFKQRAKRQHEQKEKAEMALAAMVAHK